MRARLSTRGRLVIPAEVRRRHGWREGTELLVEDHGTHLVLRAAPRVPRTQVRDLVGCTGFEGRRKTLEEMDVGISGGAQPAQVTAAEKTPFDE